MLKPKNVPMQPGVMLEYQDCPETPDPREQKVSDHSWLNCNLHFNFAATWTRCDIAHPAAQLSRFCASPGASHWAALHHLMGSLYLDANKTFKLTCASAIYAAAAKSCASRRSFPPSRRGSTASKPDSALACANSSNLPGPTVTVPGHRRAGNHPDSLQVIWSACARVGPKTP